MVNDCDWYVARSLQEALKVASHEIGVPIDDKLFEGAYEVSEQDIHRLKLRFEDGSPDVTFYEDLQRIIESGNLEPQFFASTEL